MSKMKWDQIGERYYENGVDHGVISLLSDGVYGDVEPWSGLTKVTEKPSGAEPTALYADNIKYLNLISNETFAFGIEAYTYPDTFGKCCGEVEFKPGVIITGQPRLPFGFSWRTGIGSDVDALGAKYKIHIAYNCLAGTTDKDRNTVNETPEANAMSWDVSTTPVEVPGMPRPTAHIVIDSSTVSATEMKAFEDFLYGTDEHKGKFPTPEDLITLFPKTEAAG